jgi:hypothetical protein
MAERFGRRHGWVIGAYINVTCRYMLSAASCIHVTLSLVVYNTYQAQKALLASERSEKAT